MRSWQDIGKDLNKPGGTPVNNLILEVLLDLREYARRTEAREQPDRVDEWGHPLSTAGSFELPFGAIRDILSDKPLRRPNRNQPLPAGENPPPPPNATTTQVAKKPNIFVTSPDAVEPDMMEAIANACRRIREPGYGRCRTCASYGGEGWRCNFGDGVMEITNGPDFGCIHYKETEDEHA